MASLAMFSTVKDVFAQQKILEGIFNSEICYKYD